jgi:RecA/RadA recombinase
MPTVSESAKKAKEALLAKGPAPRTLTNADFVSIGITPMNLGASGRVFGGIQKGTINRVIGKSQTGKTFVTGGILCEAAINPSFKDYELIHNDIERGLKIDPRKFWKPLVARLKAPIFGNWEPPKTLNEWYASLDKRLEKEQKFIEITDSLDALFAPEAEDGGFTDGKAKVHSQQLRKRIAAIEDQGSILILVQHAKVNMGNTFAELVTTGGSSPEFFSTLDIWLSKCEILKRAFKEKDIPVGVMFQAHIRKNRTNGVDRTVRFPLYYEYGPDDMGACVWFLLEYSHWTKENGKIEAPEFGCTVERVERDGKSVIVKGTDKRLFALDLVKKIEQDSKQQDLRMLVGSVWKEIEAALSMNRKPRYS